MIVGSIMRTETDRFSRILEAIESERRHEEAFFREISEKKSLQEKVVLGFVWCPVIITRSYYTVGEYLEIEIVRKKEGPSSHVFREGMAVILFNIQHEKQEFKAIVSYVKGNTMRLMVHNDSMADRDVFEKGLTGVEAMYDEKPYRTMTQAIKTLTGSKYDRYRILINGLHNGNFSALDYDLPELQEWHPATMSLNTSQRQAIEICVKAPLTAIIHGPPGTGKTTTLVALAQQLLLSEKRILVCAPSNNAADLLASKLHDAGCRVIRLGNITRIHDHLTQLTIEEKVRNHSSWGHIKKVKMDASELDKQAGQYKRSFGIAEREQRANLRKEARELRKWATTLEKRLMEEILDDTQIVATTLIGASHSLLKDFHFKTVIIDEASQALEPECWNAMLKADRVIFAGDHKQLPPTVKSREAVQLGMEETLLDILTDQIRHTSMLTEQYRMNHGILAFSNAHFYSGKLQSHESVAIRTLRNDPNPVLFIDTAGCGFEESRDPDGKSLWNGGEYGLIREHLLQHHENVLGEQIGIISPYAAQVRYITNELSTESGLSGLDIEVNSIDGFQGQEKDVIYISWVRSNSSGEIGFVKDERRLNVALTRARKKLVIIGDSATLGQHSLFGKFMDYIEKSASYDSGWSYMGY
jgi:superfamily I DNA and/or RNA helicase